MAAVNAETASNRIVAGMMARNPAIRNTGFRKAMVAQFPRIEGMREMCNFIPDAYHVSEANEIVTLIEVDDTNPINGAKADKIADFAYALDDIEWEVHVVVIDYAGFIKAAVPGYAFSPAFTGNFTPPGCLDFTPAARAVSVEFDRAPREWAEGELEAVAEKMNRMGL